MVKKTGRNKSLKKTVIAAILIIAFGFIIAIGVYRNQYPAKKSAAEFFEIFDHSFLDREYREPTIAEGGGPETSNTVIVYGIKFKLKAIGGDAHNVIVEGWGEAEPENFDVILKDQDVTVEQMSNRPYGIAIERENGKFPFTVKIISSEAEGEIIINF